MVKTSDREAMASQLVFDLGHRPALERDDFLVSECNQEAVKWIDSWPKWPSSLLIMVGNSGSGKSHLAGVWQAKSGASVLRSDDLMDLEDPWSLFTPIAACVVEYNPLQFNAEALLHIINTANEINAYLLMTADKPPSKWPIELPDLRSRVRTAPVAFLNDPDEKLLAAVMVKLFSDRQLKVEPEVISYIIPRIERTFEAALKLVSELDRAALSERRAITVPLTKKIMHRYS